MTKLEGIILGWICLAFQWGLLAINHLIISLLLGITGFVLLWNIGIKKEK
jgi:hypothetical protein